ncbi:MAG: rhodanese-like domain-containing protein [Agathobacter sp.]
MEKSEKRYNIEVKRKCSIMFLFIILIMSIVLLILYVYSQKLDYKIISSTEEFFEFYDSSGPVEILIDLRDEQDYALGHLSKFINVPYSGSKKEETLKNFLDENYSKNNVIVLMCYSSKRASDAFMYLDEIGYNNLVLINIDSCDILDSGKDIQTGECNCID